MESLAKRKWEYIEWADAFGPKDSARISRDNLADIVENCEVICSVAGCVVYEDDEYLTMVHQVWDTMWEETPHEECEIGAYIKIPKSLIRVRKELYQNDKE
jgi:hypothetical protein